MSNLKQMIKNEFDKDTGLETRLALKMGYKSSSPLNKFLKYEERETDNFNGLLILVRELFPDREFELMEEYIKTLEPENYTARMCLEYTEINKLNETHAYLLDKMINCGNAKSKEWAKAYSLENGVKNCITSPSEAIDSIEEMSPKSKEVKVFLNISKFYNYYDLILN